VLLRPLSLRSFLFKSRFFFSHLMIRLVEIIILVRNPQTQHQIWFFFLPLQNRPRVHRSFRTWILSSARVVVVPRVSRKEEEVLSQKYGVLRRKKIETFFRNEEKETFLRLTKTVSLCNN
jgi:hypothetical protein